MHRILAIIERDLRRFRRSPTLILVAMVMPLVQLVVLGYAFGGNIRDLKLGIVNQDRGLDPTHDGMSQDHVPSEKIKELCQAVMANSRVFVTTDYTDQATAIRDLREGKINAVLNIPPLFSRKVVAGYNPEIGLIEDNTDQFSVATLEGTFSQLLASFNAKSPPPHINPEATLAVVEIYPYVPYIQYLLPGTIVLAIFVSAMIGGGIIFIDDKARGLHEGYLVTPISKLDLILGFNLAGAIKAILAGFVLVTLGSVIAGIPNPLDPLRLIRMMILVVFTSLALISMMFLLMVRVNDPLVPRAIFGVLNTVLFFPSGAVYPQNAFPPWMKVIAIIDPFTYAVHGFKQLILKNTGLAAIGFDLFFLAVFTAIAMAAATLLFKRTL